MLEFRRICKLLCRLCTRTAAPSDHLGAAFQGVGAGPIFSFNLRITSWRNGLICCFKDTPCFLCIPQAVNATVDNLEVVIHLLDLMLPLTYGHGIAIQGKLLHETLKPRVF